MNKNREESFDNFTDLCIVLFCVLSDADLGPWVLFLGAEIEGLTQFLGV